MNILITGIHGFIGSNLVKELSPRHKIYGLDIIFPKKEGVVITFDWTDLERGEIPEVDVIIHLAGKAHDVKNTSRAEEYFNINTGLTRKIYDYFLQSQAGKFIFFSSVKAVADAVNGDILTEEVTPTPIGPYGESKLKAEEYILEHSALRSQLSALSSQLSDTVPEPSRGVSFEQSALNLSRFNIGSSQHSESIQQGTSQNPKPRTQNKELNTEKKLTTPNSKLSTDKEPSTQNSELKTKKVYILRPCMIHGPGNKGNLNLLYNLVKKGIPWPLGAFENKRSFTSIDNLNFIVTQLAERNIPAGIYNIADDEALSTNEVIRIIREVLSSELKVLSQQSAVSSQQSVEGLSTVSHQLSAEEQRTKNKEQETQNPEPKTQNKEPLDPARGPLTTHDSLLTTRILNIPKPLIKTLARIGTALHLPLNNNRLHKLTENYVVSNEKIKKALGVKSLPVSARDGLRRTIESFK